MKSLRTLSLVAALLFVAVVATQGSDHKNAVVSIKHVASPAVVAFTVIGLNYIPVETGEVIRPLFVDSAKPSKGFASIAIRPPIRKTFHG